jgi:hypothetical protein
VWGGQAFNTSGSRVRLSSMMYVLDFASRLPRWRQAHIRLNNQGAFQFDFPSTGLVMLPEFGAVALKHRSVSEGCTLHPTSSLALAVKTVGLVMQGRLTCWHLQSSRHFCCV